MKHIIWCGIVLFVMSPISAFAQTAISVNPNTGTSTLDNLKPARGDGIELEFPSGFRCKVQSGDVPSFVFYGDQGNLNSVSGSRIGVSLVIPLYTSRIDTCDNSMKIQDASSMLELADRMLQNGSMTNEEYVKVTTEIKSRIFNLR